MRFSSIISADRSVRRPSDDAFLALVFSIVALFILSAFPSPGQAQSGKTCGPGGSWGDPHLITVDGLTYDFQAVGEFTLLESELGTLKMQVRQAAYGSSNRVSVNKAFAFDVNGDRVGIYRTSNGLRTFINSRVVNIQTNQTLDNGGLVTQETTSAFSIKWPDGSWARVSANGSGANGYLDLKFLISDIHTGKLTGLLGDYDGDPGNDISIRGSATSLGTNVAFETLYGDYANSWRVNQGNSLFDYGSGENTATFTNRNFPRNSANTADLSAERRAAAERICRAAGIIDPLLLEACIVDVGFTEDGSFADSISDANSPEEGADIFQGWRLYGTARRAGANLRLTTNKWQLGAAYRKNTKLNLSEDFDLRFTVYVGNDDAGADGILLTFLKEIPEELGSAGGALGFNAVCDKCIGIELDTYQNSSDIPEDHIAIVENGSVSHSGNLPIEPVENVEDGREHELRVRWTAATKTIRVDLDSTTRLTTQLDLAQAVESNEIVYGIHAATGDFSALHYFRPKTGPLGISGRSNRTSEISNYDFEQKCEIASVSSELRRGAACLNGWNVEGDVKRVRDHRRSSGGDYGVSLSGRRAGRITQLIDTEPGKKYRINFDLIRNTRGSYGNGFVRVETGDGEFRNFRFSGSNGRRSDSEHTRQYWSFTANHPQTRISFLGQRTDDSAGPLIDNIHVFEEPDTLRVGYRSDCQNEGGGGSSSGSSGGSGGGSNSSSSSGGDGGDPPPNTCPGDSQLNPISPEAGCKFQLETDYVGDSGLGFTRKYDSSGFYYRGNSDPPEKNGYHHWRHSHQYQLFKIKIDRHSVLRPNGHIWYFDSDGKQENAHGGALGKLKKTRTGWTLTRTDGVKEFYNSRGRIKKILEPDGDFLTYSYSSRRNRLIRVNDRYGKSLKFSYNSKGQLLRMTDPAGRHTSYLYNRKGNLSRATYPDGTAKQYQYKDRNDDHALTAIFDKNKDRSASFAYDSEGKPIYSGHARTTNRVGQESGTVDYDGDDFATITDAEGYRKKFTYEDVGKIRRWSRVDYENEPGDGSDDTFETRSFDEDGNLTEERDQTGRITRYGYNAAGQLTRMTEAAGSPEQRVTTYRYLSPKLDLVTFERQESVASGQRKEIETRWNKRTLNKTLEIIRGYQADGSAMEPQATRYRYYDGSDETNFLSGKLKSVDGPRDDVSDVVRYRYYDCNRGAACGQLRAIVNAKRHKVIFSEYDSHGRIQEIVDPNGLKTSYKYDVMGRVVTVVESHRSTRVIRVTRYGYDRLGQLAWAKAPTGEILGYRYDAAHDLTHVYDGVRLNRSGKIISHVNEIRYRYDARGNRESASIYNKANKRTHRLTWAYDAWNRVRVINAGTAGSNDTSGYENDANGNLLASIDGRYFGEDNSKKTSYNYDALNRIQKMLDLAGGETEFDYDAQDNLTRVKAPNNATTTFEYDDQGNTLVEMSPDRGRIEMSYDEANNLVWRWDARGIQAVYSYDSLNRVTTVKYRGGEGPNVDLRYVYDNCRYGKGRLCQVIKGNGTRLSYSYDAFGNVTEAAEKVDRTWLRTRYQYEKATRVSSIRYPNGIQVIYAYDRLGQVSGISAKIRSRTYRLASGIQYQPFGPFKRIEYGNGLVETRRHDSQYRVSKISLSSVYDWKYGYDGASNIEAIGDATGYFGDSSYEYDELMRLDAGRGAFGSVAYSYDANGNRIGEDSDGDGLTDTFFDYQIATNRLISAGSSIYGRDDAGNLTNKDGATYRYTRDNRLTLVEQPGQEPVSFRYNAFSQRVEKRIGGELTRFHHAADGRLLLEVMPNGMSRTYVYLGLTPVAVIDARLVNESIRGTPKVYYAHSDHLFTTRAVSDQSSQVIWRWDSDPFGAVAPDSDPDRNNRPYLFNLRFPGQYFDSETGVSYNWNRYYSSSIGRYITSDSLGIFGGFNSFQYALSDPNAYFDIEGKHPVIIIIGEGLIVAGAAYLGCKVVGGCSFDPKMQLPNLPRPELTFDPVTNRPRLGFQCKSDSGKNEKHGDSGRAKKKSKKRIEALEKELATATGRQKKRIKNKIENIIKDADKKAKGEEHSRRGK